MKKLIPFIFILFFFGGFNVQTISPLHVLSGSTILGQAPVKVGVVGGGYDIPVMKEMLAPTLGTLHTATFNENALANDVSKINISSPRVVNVSLLPLYYSSFALGGSSVKAQSLGSLSRDIPLLDQLSLSIYCSLASLSTSVDKTRCNYNTLLTQTTNTATDTTVATNNTEVSTTTLSIGVPTTSDTTAKTPTFASVSSSPIYINNYITKYIEGPAGPQGPAGKDGVNGKDAIAYSNYITPVSYSPTPQSLIGVSTIGYLRGTTIEYANFSYGSSTNMYLANANIASSVFSGQNTFNDSALFTGNVTINSLTATTSNLLNTTLTNSTTTNAVITNATTTNSFISSLTVDNASTTNFSAYGATFGNIYATGTLGVAGQTTLANASTTNLTVANNAYFGTNTGIWNSSGNIGIGTTTPTSKLSIITSTVPAITAKRNISTFFQAIGEFTDTNGNVGVTIGGTSLYASGPTTNQELDISSRGTGILYLNSSGLSTGNIVMASAGGLVGIGTTTPGSLFSVNGNSYFGGNVTATGTISIEGTSTFATRIGSVGIGTTTPFGALTVQGTSTFVGASSSPTALRVLGNIDNTSGGINLTKLGSVSISGSPSAIGVVGHYAYVVNATNKMYVVDVSNPSFPTIVGSSSLLSSASGISISGNYAYVICASTGLCAYDLTNPYSPTFVGSTTLLSDTSNLYASGRYVYTVHSSATNKLQITDVSNPASPVNIGSVSVGPINSDPGSVFVYGKYAYVTNNSSNSVSIIDISDPASPVVASTTRNLTTPKRIVVSGRYAYIGSATTNTLQVADVSSSTNPVIVGTVNTTGNTNSLALFGRYVIGANGTQVDIIDVSSSTAPVIVASTTPSSTPTSLAISGRYAYVNTSNSLQIIDLGGIETTSAIIHALQVGNLQVRNDVSTQGNLSVGSTLNVGIGGIFSLGSASIFGSGSATSSAFSVASSSGTALFNVLMNGNVGIGTSTPGAKLDIYSTTSGGIVFDRLGNRIQMGADSAGGYVGTLTNNVFRIITNNSEQMRVDTAGNVGIGTTSPNGTLDVRRTYDGTDGVILRIGDSGLSTTNFDFIRNHSTGALQIQGNQVGNNNIIFAPSSGNVGIGTTAPGSLFNVGSKTSSGGVSPYVQIGASNSGADVLGLSIVNSAAGAVGNAAVLGFNNGSDYSTTAQIKSRTDSSSAPLQVSLRFSTYNSANDALGERMVISGTGSIKFNAYGAGTLSTDASGNVTSSSDERLKDIQGSFTRGLADIMKINPISYKWNALSGLETNGTYSGFSAQNMQTAIPEAVGQGANGYLSLQDRPIIAASVNAIKELSSSLNSLSDSQLSFYTPSEALDLGTVIAFSDVSTSTIKKATNSSEAIGIVTTSTNTSTTTSGIPVVFSGKVTVQVTNENGTIKKGDYLTVSSSTPGKAERLTTEGQSLGRALSDDDGTGRITMLLNTGYQKVDTNSRTATTSGMLTTGNLDLNANAVAIYNIKSLASANGSWSIDENGRITAKVLCIEDVCIDKTTLTNILNSTGQTNVGLPGTHAFAGTIDTSTTTTSTTTLIDTGTTTPTVTPVDTSTTTPVTDGGVSSSSTVPVIDFSTIYSTSTSTP